MLQLHIIVLYQKLIHNARTHLDYSQKGNPGRALVILWQLELQNYLAEIGEFGSLAEDARAPGAGTGPCRPSTESCVLTGVWEFKEFVQLQG